jgi:hypothetical protein
MRVHVCVFELSVCVRARVRERERKRGVLLFGACVCERDLYYVSDSVVFNLFACVCLCVRACVCMRARVCVRVFVKKTG